MLAALRVSADDDSDSRRHDVHSTCAPQTTLGRDRAPAATARAMTCTRAARRSRHLLRPTAVLLPGFRQRVCLVVRRPDRCPAGLRFQPMTRGSHRRLVEDPVVASGSVVHSPGSVVQADGRRLPCARERAAWPLVSPVEPMLLRESGRPAGCCVRYRRLQFASVLIPGCEGPAPATSQCLIVSWPDALALSDVSNTMAAPREARPPPEPLLAEADISRASRLRPDDRGRPSSPATRHDRQLADQVRFIAMTSGATAASEVAWSRVNRAYVDNCTLPRP